MSSSTQRRVVQRFGLAGIGTAVLLVGIASPALAATDVVIPLEPTEVALSAVPVDGSGGAMDPSTGWDGASGAPVDVQYGGTITVDLPDGLDGSDAGAELVFDDNGDGTPEATYSSRFAAGNPNRLVVVPTADSVTITLPADDPIAGDAARLDIEPLESTLSPAFSYFDPLSYELAFDPAAAPGAETVAPVLLGYSTLPCALFSQDPCPFPTPVTAGSTVTLDLSEQSALRELGLTDLEGVELSLGPVDADGNPTGALVPVTAQVSGTTASFVVPAGTAPGQYSLLVVDQASSGNVGVVEIGLTVEAAPAAAPTTTAAPTTAAPSTQAVVANTGLKSNTGVYEASAAEESGSPAVVAAGAGLLLAAGVGGVVVARRRRPAVEAGTGEA
ncbi:hypothetical protein ACI79J_18900 [Geodermatophilus sp. SYSU D01062]